MQGLEISREFYLKYGKEMIDCEFAELVPRITVGLVGEGSECLGFDDELSRDHDFDPGFCIFITAEDERKYGFALERAYAKLPREFMGLKRSIVSPVGGSRRGVITVEDFYTRFLGAPNAPDTTERWLYTPTFSLLAASNGEIFADVQTEFTSIRNILCQGYPEDVRLKKLAAHTLLAAQAGQYNYPRALARHENGAAQLAVFEYVKHVISCIYLLNNSYEPFYKWAFRGLEKLPRLSDVGELLISLIELDNSAKVAETKLEVIEDIAVLLIDEFKAQGISEAICTDLEKHAYSISDGIKDTTLRNMHIMEGA